jgi:hypothetical protein
LETLSDSERAYLHGMIDQPIYWSDGDGGLSDGQHRSCALRAAGVARVPVKGSFPDDRDYDPPIPPAAHARMTVDGYDDRT